ncbi:ComEC/Rec2 family competence protein, partial [Helicobacter typhlonius]
MQDSIKASHSPFDVELFSTRVQWVVFVCACVIVFALNLWQEYRAYREFSTKENKEIYAQVINQYTKHKNGKTYEVLKLKTKQGEIFYTTSREDIKDLSHRFVRIYGKGLECSFVSYLQHCFFVSYRISLLNERDYRDFLREWIETQHTESAIASLYKTLFMADALPSIWRDLSARLGIAHLIAISGFHLGILSFVLGWILSSIYRIFHHRLSYRNKYFDVGFMVLVGLFAYLLLLDFTPSFLRAFTMAVCGFLVVYSGIKLFSFRLLVV